MDAPSITNPQPVNNDEYRYLPKFIHSIKDTVSYYMGAVVEAVNPLPYLTYLNGARSGASMPLQASLHDGGVFDLKRISHGPDTNHRYLNYYVKPSSEMNAEIRLLWTSSIRDKSYERGSGYLYRMDDIKSEKYDTDWMDCTFSTIGIGDDAIIFSVKPDARIYQVASSFDLDLLTLTYPGWDERTGEKVTDWNRVAKDYDAVHYTYALGRSSFWISAESTAWLNGNAVQYIQHAVTGDSADDIVFSRNNAAVDG